MMKTILVVDDDKSNLLRAQMILKEEYHEILVISGRQALYYLEKRVPDLVLLDIEMPDMNGYEVLEKMKANPEWEKIPVIFLSANVDKTTEIKCLQKGGVDFIAKPFEPELMMSRVRKAIELEEYKKTLESYKLNLEIEVQEQAKKICEMQKKVIISMANIMESRDGSTGEHVKRTSLYVEMIARELMQKHYFKGVLTEQYFNDLCNAAPIHDIGKIKIPDSILTKPGKLTEEEFEQMKSHAVEGGKIIRQTMWEIEEQEYVQVAIDVATYHHEKWNGEGYPEGLIGEQIPLGARIMAIADVFDALISKRCYKQPMRMEDAMAVIAASKGTHFDPIITEVFLSLRKRIEQIVRLQAF